MTDAFHNYTESLDAPADNAFAITPADGTDLAKTTRAVYVGGDGDLVCLLAGDTVAVTFAGLTAGTILPVRVVRVMEATTATNLVGLH